MDLQGLNIFIQAAELKSFTRAGEKLGYSQPTVSFQIKQLEKELGIRLFDRIGHTVALTDAGKEALAYAHRICYLTEEMSRTHMHDNGPSGLVRIATAESLLRPLIVKQLPEIRRLYPGISVKVITAGTDDLFRLLDHNEVDLVCTLDEHIYDTSYIMEGEEKLDVHIVCSKDNPLSEKPLIDRYDVINEPFILTEKGMSYRKIIDRKLAESSLEIRPVLEIGNVDLIKELVVNNTGLSLLPDFVTEKEVKEGSLVRLNSGSFNMSVWKQLIYHRNKWMSAQMKAVLALIKNTEL